MPLYQHVARTIASEWNGDGNCAPVVGATFPEELKVIRGIVGDMPLLIPGIGAQGGDVEATVRNGKTADGTGLMINSSRGILYAWRRGLRRCRCERRARTSGHDQPVLLIAYLLRALAEEAELLLAEVLDAGEDRGHAR